MQYLWITAQKLRREADRQEVEARRIFIEIKGLGLQQVLCPYWNAPPLRILLTSSTTAHSVLPCTKPGNKIPYPPTNITTTKNTRKPDRYWRWQWRIRWTKWWLLHCRVNLFHASLLPLTLSRMHQSMTSIFWMSTIHMRSLLSTSAGTLSVWLFRKKLKPVTSTIVGDIVTNSFLLLQHAEHAFTYSFSSMIDMCLPRGGHAFPYDYPLSTLCFTCVHLKANTFPYLFKPVVRQLYSLAFH